MPIRITQINHVAHLVSNIERSVDFYSRCLGLARKPRPNFGDVGAWFQICPGQELHVIEKRGIAPAPNEAPTHFALVIANQTDALAHLESCGIPYTEPKTRPDGAVQIFIRDPDNYLIELTCNLPQ